MPSVDETYLFIDGEYIRTIYREAMQRFWGLDGDLEPARLRYTGMSFRTYFYDSIDDAKREGESEAVFQSRVAAQEQFFNEIRAVSGFHARLGSVTGKKKRRQKEVDVLLAVDMLTHGLGGNMKKAILLAGDLDFRPIVETLVQRGVFVEVWFEKRSAAKELYGAADSGREIPFSELYSRSRESFIKTHPLPHRISGDSIPPGEPIKRGKLGTSTARLFHSDNCYRLWVEPFSGTSLKITVPDLTHIERLMEMEYEPIVWDV